MTHMANDLVLLLRQTTASGPIVPTRIAALHRQGINPCDYLVDVLARVQDHPAAALDELLPAAWARAS
jgi:hypothetical protein